MQPSPDPQTSLAPRGGGRRHWRRNVLVLLGVILMVSAAAVVAPHSANAAVIDTSAFYELVSRHSGKAIDITDRSTADGANVQQWADNGGTNQQFRVADTDSGFVKLVNRKSAKPLDVVGWSTADGGRISQYADHGGANQQWQLVKVGAAPTTKYAGYLFTH